MLDNVNMQRPLNPNDFTDSSYQGVYEELESTGTRLYDTEYLEQGYLVQKDPFVFSHAGDDYVISSRLSENGVYWQIYLNGTIIF